MKIATSQALKKHPSERVKITRKISKFWDKISAGWQEIWGPHIHHGYFDHSEDLSPLKAQELLIKKLIEFAGLRQKARILDVGCGIGGTSLFLAQKYEADVTGITLSQKQVKMAKDGTNRLGVRNVHFQVEDALTLTSFGDQSFDWVWSLESCEQFFDKPLFLRQAYRVLKPGGRLLLATWCSSEEEYENGAARDYIKLCRAFDLPYMPTIPFYEKALIDQGFKLLKGADWTDKVEKSWSLGITAAKKKSIFYLLSQGGWRGLKFVLQLERMRKAFREQRIKYGVFLGLKP